MGEENMILFIYFNHVTNALKTFLLVAIFFQPLYIFTARFDHFLVLPPLVVYLCVFHVSCVF